MSVVESIRLMALMDLLYFDEIQAIKQALQLTWLPDSVCYF